MNLTQLRLFRDVARELSFVKAARQNHISQPAVSVHIKKLEDELGKKLFNRAPHRIQLTPDGMMILAEVKEILQRCEGLKISSSYSQGVLEGAIRIATIHSIGMYELGDFLASFMKAFPRVHIHIEYRRSDDIYLLLQQERIDLGIVAYPERRTQIEAIPYANDELVLIVPRDHPLFSKKSVPLQQIEGEAFIGFEQGVPTREATDRLLAESGVSVDLRMTNDNIYPLKKAVEAGVGVSVVPANAVDEEVHRGTLARIRIRHLDTQRPLALLKLKNRQPATPLAIFIEKMLAYGRQEQTGSA